MSPRSSLLLTSSALLVASSASFAPTVSGVTKNSVRLASATSDEDPPVIGEQQQQQLEEEPVYYKILSEADPVPNAPYPSFAANAGTTTAAASYPTLNGWYPKEDFALWGLPGAIAPTGYFDPLGFAREGTPLNDAKRLRESEVMHGRVAMLATVGYLAAEALPSPLGVTGPANDQLQQVPAPAFWLLTTLIAAAELYRAKLGWVEPKFAIGSKTLWTLRDSYYPGDLGFDPLGLKPAENYEFQRMQTKELQHGRLAMLGWAGMCAQELVNHRTIGETLDFYQYVFNGGNPYEYY